MKESLGYKVDWLKRMFFILVSIFIFQSNIIPVSASSIIFLQGHHHNGISYIYSYGEIESSAYAEVGLTGGPSRVLSVKGVRTNHEVLARASNVAAKGRRSAKSTLLGAGIGGLAGGIQAELRGYRFLDGRSKVLTERYQLATGNNPLTEETPNSISGRRPMSKGDAIERGEVGLIGDRSVDRLGTDINRGFEGDLRLRGNAYVPEGQEFYVNVDGVDVVRSTSGRIDRPIPSNGKNISWGYRGTAIQQTTTQNGLNIGVTVRPNSYLYITGNHRGWDGFLFWGR